jgi:oligopeptide transport system substrate-binding protein
MKNIVLNLLPILCVFLISCKNDKTLKDDSDIYGGTLNVLLADPVESLDPLEILYSSDWMVSSAIYEGLVCYRENFKQVMPLLAKSWKSYENSLKFIFTLKKNTHFHNNPCFRNGYGREVTSRDIEFTFYRMASPEQTAVQGHLFIDLIAGMREFYNSETDSIKGIKIIDKYTIQFELNNTYSIFPKLLSCPSAFIVPREAIEFYKDSFKKHPVGTGPFRISNWIEWQKIELTRSDTYWQNDSLNRSLPYLDNISFSYMFNNNLVAEFLKNKDNLIKIDYKSLMLLKNIEGFRNNYELNIIPHAVCSRFWTFSMEKNNIITRDKNVRKKIATCFNRDYINKPGNKYKKTANSLCPEDFFNDYSFNWYEFVDDYSITSPKVNLDLFVSAEVNGLKDFENALTAAGIKPNLTVQPAKYYEKIIKERPDIFRISMTPSFPDPIEYYALFYSKSGKHINLCRFSDPEYDRIYELSLTETNPEYREELFIELERILKEQIPVVYIEHESSSFFVFPENIKGFSLRFLNPDFSKIWIVNNIEKE